MRGLLLTLGACVLITSLATGEASAAAAPRCPLEAINVIINTPAYGRAEQGLKLKLYTYSPARNANVTITVASVAGRVTTPLTLTKEETDVIVAAGPADLETEVILEWDQDQGTPAACHGFHRDVVPVVPQDAEIGDPYFPRFEGVFKLREGSRVETAKWRVRPTCGYFSCDVEIGPARKSARFRLTGNGRYEFERVEPPTEDCVTRDKRESLVARNVYRAHDRWVLRVTGESGGLVTDFVVQLRVIWEPTRRGERAGCRSLDHEFLRFTGHRVGAV